MTARLLALLIVLRAGQAAAAEAPGQAPWIDLFDGKTLRGWVQRGGGARYETRDGTIVGSSVPNTKNSFLCTERRFGDFALEMEFKADGKLNGGIQIRGQSSPDYQDGRVHGYQIEIDPDVERGRMWTAGVYDEGRRGWLYEVRDDEAAHRAFKPEDWNHLRVEARGDSIKTWLNGVPVADIVDSVDLDGFIALQVHQVGKREEPLRHAWRNIRIQDLGRRTWMPAIDGKSLAGLHPAGGGKWAVDGGMIIGTITPDARAPGLLFVDRKESDFTARLEYRLTGGNSGLYFGAEPADGPGGARGLQADFDAVSAGGVYETGGRGWIARAKPPAKVPGPTEGNWHTLTVSARGGRVVVHADDRQTVDLRDEAGVKTGQLALELATGAGSRLEVRRLDLLSPAILPPVPGFPVGWCIRVQGTAPEEAKAMGYEYIELSLKDVLDLPDEEFERLVVRLGALGVPATAGYDLVPEDLKLVGPEVDKGRQDARIKLGFTRAARLGLKAVVFNSGPARRAPEDFPRARALEQLVDFTRRAAAEGARHGIAFLVEPLRSTDTNMITTVAEALALVKAVGRPNVQLLVDYSFLVIQKEDPRVLLAARGKLHHIHIANPDGRGYPMSAAPYGELFSVLGQIGYRGGFSVHAKTDLVAADAPRAISFLREQAAALPRRVPPPGFDQHSLPATGNVTR